jgi:hypothetical protein
MATAAGPGITASPGGRSAPRRRSWCSWRIARRCPTWSRSPSRLVALAAVAALACKATPAREAPTPAAIDAALARGGAFLAGLQEDDGAIRTSTYAVFRDGWSLTPLAMAALRFTPGQEEAYARGVDFVATLAGAEPAGVRYPLYAEALGAIVLNAPGNQRHLGARDALLARLRARQRADGGWGYFDDASNLSATVFAVGAIALAGAAPDDPALAAARRFAGRCQAADGGFFFSPDLADGNKAGLGVAYGSMTADGVRVLLRTGAPLDEPALAAGAAWLRARFDPARNPGDFPRNAELRRASAYYYWAWSSAHALRALGGDPGWATALAAELLSRQGADGAWRNTAGEMREDDPVVATSFAIAALAVARAVIAGEHRSHAAP